MLKSRRELYLIFSLLISICSILLTCVLLSCENPLIQQIWELKTVDFNSNGGSFVDSQTLLKGQKVERPDDPVKTNYKFTYWCDDETLAQEWDFNVAPTGDLTLYAGWRDYGLTLSPAGDLDFGIADIGYTSTETKIVEVKNTTDEDIAEVHVKLDNSSFTITPVTFSLASGDSRNLTIFPNMGLPVGVYTAAVTITGGGYTVSFNSRFEVTPGTITGIELITPPTKMEYTHGENLDLTGLEVKLTYSGGYTENVPFTQFASKDLTTDPANGITLSHSIHDGYSITVSHNDVLYPENAGQLIVNKIRVDDFYFPTASSIILGQTLADSALTPVSNEFGSFAWEDSTIAPVVGSHSCNVVFTPSDTDNYDYTGVAGWNGATVTRLVSITVIDNNSSVTITLDIEQITEGAPIVGDNFTLSRTGTGGNPQTKTIEITDSGQYSAISWEIAGVGVYAGEIINLGTAATVSLDAADSRYISLGGHVLVLKVTYNGMSYQRNILFTVVN